LRALSDTYAQENLSRSEWLTGIGSVKLPAHSLIKLELRYRLCLFRVSAIGLIEIGLKDRNFNATFPSIAKQIYPILICSARLFIVSSVSEDVDSALVGFLGENDAFERVI